VITGIGLELAPRHESADPLDAKDEQRQAGGATAAAASGWSDGLAARVESTLADSPATQRRERGRVSVIESTMAAAAKGPPLHTHAFNDTFYVLEGELTFQLGDEHTLVGAGGVAFAPRGSPHTLANRSEAPARFLIVCTPAVFEREFARRTAAFAGTEPQAWAMQPIPEVTGVGPRIGDVETRKAPRLKEPHVQDLTA
jgi:quercetin dioxygenase-like cupin family protein